jgi:AcrR family transcriptional regulator
MTTTFQRARSDEQRAERRRAILDTAAAMLAEMPVAQVSLNELSRRVGLAKSNVLRYFESREAVLLELLDAASREWLGQLPGELAEAEARAEVEAQAEAGSSPGARALTGRAGQRERGDRLAAVVAASLAARPVLCDLVSTQAAVLERNVSPKVAAQHKYASLETFGELARLVGEQMPELDEQDAVRFGAGVVVVSGALWTHAHPTAAMLVAYEADPTLASMRLDFADALRQMLEVLLSGLLARASDARPVGQTDPSLD